MRILLSSDTIGVMWISSNTARILRLTTALVFTLVSIWIVFTSVKHTLPALSSSTEVAALDNYANAVSSGNYEQALIYAAGLREGVDNGVAKVLYSVDPLTCLAIDTPKYKVSSSLSVARVNPVVCKQSVPVVVVRPGG